MAQDRKNYNDQFLANAHAHELISKVVNVADRDENMAILLSVNLKNKALGLVITFLKESFSEKYPLATEKLNLRVKNITKDIMLNQILDFVVFSLPHPCLKCTNDYLPYVQTDSAEEDIKCFVCKLPAHRECYKNEDVKLHLVYLCNICLTADKKEDTKEEVVTERKNENPEQPVEIESSEDESDSEEDTEKDEDTTDDEEGRPKSDMQWMKKEKKKRKRKEVRVDQKVDQVCPLLIDGKCPFGISGKGCKYKHKRICYKYCAFGSIMMHKGGCKFNDECWFLHPKLCQNSVGMRMCLDEKCTHVHLRYTRRSKQGGGERNENRKPINQRDRTNGQNYQRQYEQDRPRNGSYKNESRQSRYRSNSRSEPRNSQQHFLVQMMKDMQNQLAAQIQREIRKQFQYQPQTEIQQEVDEQYQAEYPSVQEHGNQAWNPREGRW